MAEEDKKIVTKSETALREEEVLKFWKEDGTFEKSLAKEAPEGDFVFYDGPPFATGLPHHGSLLSSIIKDVIPRYKTMRGFRVRRRWGWDTHGLPIESLVEKELGLKTKKDILDIGIDVFNEGARSMVLRYVGEWEKYVERVGRWVDFRNSYKTMDNSYIESVWWALSELSKNKLLYEGNKVLMYCPHCETPLAKAEIAMDNTYKDITEEAVTVKFKVKDPTKKSLPENTYLLAWTTTPWTLPGNVGLAVGEGIDYSLATEGEEHLILATERLAILREGKNSQIVTNGQLHNLKGSDLVGLEYEPLYEVPTVKVHQGKKHMVLPADFVSTEEGTGIVHTAVMYGEDDFVLGQKEGLPMVQLLNANGTFNEQAPEFVRGKYIKEAERDIKRDLESRGLMFEKKNNTHSYPHCYRCGTPLIYNAVSSWFINIQKVKDKMLSENEKVNWVPEHLKRGRFKHIVESAPDWTISRNRFWASPLPIWKEKGGSGVMVIGSLEELKKRTKKSGNSYFVMRHGEAHSNELGIVTSKLSYENVLSEKGKEQVKRGAESLRDKKIDLIISSPLHRTMETARLVASTLGLSEEKVVTEERLHELNFGIYEQKLITEYHAFFASLSERFDKAPEGGETLGEVKRRVGEVLYGLEEKYQNKNILIVSHGDPVALSLAVAVGANLEETIKLFSEQRNSIVNAEIRELPFVPLPHNANYELDLHRPYIDKITLVGEDGHEYERIPEVIDCWVESGSMPFAELHYPYENKEDFKRRFPGDFIAEYIAQTRTWFYYMHALGVLLFDSFAFKNVITTGTILAADGEKISKSKRNYTDPLELIDRYGTDALRFHLMSSPVMQAEDLSFRDEDVRDAHNRIIQSLWNCFRFLELYKEAYDGKTEAAQSPHLLDRWILARLKWLVAETTEAYERYELPRALRPIRDFVEDYSTWYVRRSRERAKGEGQDRQYTLATQREVLSTLSLILAPVTPFLAEEIWRGLKREGSVHLASWPTVSGAGFFSRMFGNNEEDLLSRMKRLRAIVSAGLEARQRASLKVRQPLSSLSIGDKEIAEDAELCAILAEEVNVKKIIFVSGLEGAKLDTVLTPELEAEGKMRDLVRAVQDYRKKLQLNPADRVSLILSSAPTFLETYRLEIMQTVNAESIEVGEIEGDFAETDGLRLGILKK